MRPPRTGHKLKDGRWRTTRSIYVAGVAYEKDFYQRKGESQAQLTARADKWQAEGYVSPDMKISDAIKQFTADRTDISPDTKRDDAHAFGIIEKAFGVCMVRTLSFVQVEALLKEWKDKPRTAKKIRDHGRKLYFWLIKRDVTRKNPFADAKPVRYDPRNWDEEPLSSEDFFKALDKVESPMMKAHYLLLWSTGIRPKSARELMWSEIKGQYIRKVSAKTKAGTRPIYVPQVALDALNELPRTALFVFPNEKGVPFNDTWIGKVWRDAQTAAGLKPKTLYMLKHARVTRLYEAGFDAGEAAAAIGVKDAATVEKSYRQFDAKKLATRLEGV